MMFQNQGNEDNLKRIRQHKKLFLNNPVNIINLFLNASDAFVIIINEYNEVIFSNSKTNETFGIQGVEFFFQKNIFPGLSIEVSKEISVQDYHGNKIIVSWEKKPFHLSNDEVCFLLLGNDITHVKELQDKLHTLDYIIKKVPGFIFWKNKELKNVGCNENFAKQVGFKTPDELIGKTDYELPWDKFQTEQFLKDDIEVMMTGVSKLNFEEKQRQLNGEEAILLTSKVPLYDNRGEVSGILGIYIDITKQKEMEKTQKSLKKVQHQLEGAKLISGAIAHEIRTPLATIKSGIYVVQRVVNKLIGFYEKARDFCTNDIKNDDIADLKECITLINKKTDQSNTIINMLLTKLTSVDFEFTEFTNCSASECVKSALEKFIMPDIMIDKIKYNHEHDFIFFGNNTLMTHVIMNLLKNSIFYIQKAKKGKIEIWFEKKMRTNQIHFKDTALGIPDELLESIFQPFFTTELSTGSGIGLAFSKIVMESHQGTIDCFSEAGVYTEFILTFPQVGEK